MSYSYSYENPDWGGPCSGRQEQCDYCREQHWPEDLSLDYDTGENLCRACHIKRMEEMKDE